MTNNNINHFLNLVKRANDLVEELQKLESVVRSYTEVSNDLAQASRGLFDATAQYAGIASQVGQVATSMREIGMPELLDAVQSAQKEASGNSANMLIVLENLLSASQQTKSDIQALWDVLQQARQEASANSTSILSVQEALGKRVEELFSTAQSDLHFLLNASESLQEQQYREAARTRLFVIVGAGIATAAGVAATVVPILNLF